MYFMVHIRPPLNEITEKALNRPDIFQIVHGFSGIGVGFIPKVFFFTEFKILTYYEKQKPSVVVFCFAIAGYKNTGIK